MENRLKKLLSRINGTVLMIDQDEERLDVINQNKSIESIVHLTEITKVKKEDKKSKSKLKNQKVGKDLNIKKIKKTYKKNTFDFILFNIRDVERYLRKLVRNSVIISKKTIYLYGSSFRMEPENIVKRYKRYTKKVELIEYGEEDFIIIIDTTNKKRRTLSQPLFLLIDFFYWLGDLISALLIS